MKINDLGKTFKSKPLVFVDMDGVLADLYSMAAEFSDVEHYNDMTDDQWEKFFKDSDSYHLFRSIKPFSTANKLLEIVKEYAGGYIILSSPLLFDEQGSIKGKREWLKNNITVSPDKIIFEREKYIYATQSDGTPNVLIDDWGENTRAWTKHGGIAIKYQADQDSLSKVISVLEKVYRKR